MNDLTKIPGNAFIFADCELTFGDNGENAKTAPVKMKARSGQPIEHWFWGRVVHDLAGMKLLKNRVPIDYVHNDNEVIGYVNHFDTESGDLILSGALVPFKESDRATEIIFKNKAGIPYESSINFAGPGVKVQILEDGQMADVNGYTFAGPGTIIREWTLRGVAVCPYGADANTASNVFNDTKQMFAAEVIPAEQTQKEANEMSEVTKPDAVDTAVETAEAAELTVEEQAEAQGEPPAVEAEPEVAELAETPEPSKPMSVEEFKRVKDEFGAEIAAETFASGGTYESALKMAFDKTKAELAAAELRLSETSTAGGGRPVVARSIPAKIKPSLFKAQ